MKKTIHFAAILLLLVIHTHAQPILIGLNSNQNTGLASIIRWNAANGAMLDSVATTQPGSLMGSSSYNAVHQNYYFDGSMKFCRVGFNPTSFTELANSGVTTNMEVDMATGEIYAVRVIQLFDSLGGYVGSQAEFVGFNPATATETILGVLPGIAGFFMDVNCYNSNAGVYYANCIDSLGASFVVAIPTRSGSFTPRLIPISGVQPGELFTLEYDNNLDKLYGLVGVGGPFWNLQIDAIDTLTGAMTVEADFPQLVSYLMTTTTYDQASSSMIMVTIDTNQTYALNAYSNISHTLSTLQNPFPGEFVELECDNSAFAAVKYGSVTAVAGAHQSEVLTCYPNPAHDALRMDASVAITKWIVTDAMGRTVSYADHPQGTELDLSQYAPGCYMVRAQGDHGLWMQAKFIKE